jgi:hypothetical protein
MAATARRSQLYIACSPTLAAQGAFGTALSNGAITSLFSLSEEEPKLEIISKDETIKDCSGQYTVDEFTVSRSCRMTVSIYAEVATLFNLTGMAFGTVVDDVASMLSTTQFQPPVTTFIWGHRGSSTAPLKLKSMMLARLEVVGRVNERIKVNLEFRGSADILSGSGFTVPACSAIEPVYLKDCSFSINSIERLSDTREFSFVYDNRPLADEDPFTMASIEIQRMERADEREHNLKFIIFGEPGDTLETASRSNPKTKYPFALRIGAADDGVLYEAASAILKPNTFDHTGEARRSTLDLSLKPVLVVGDEDTTPLIATLLAA